MTPFDASTPLQTFVLEDLARLPPDRVLGFGCRLPDGQVAFAWHGAEATHGCFPSLAAFELLQSKLSGRKIRFCELAPDGVHSIAFRLARTEDVTGVSGSGVVAVGAQLAPSAVVLQWLGEIGSTFWYRHLNQVETLHGHGGKTRIQDYCYYGLPGERWR